MNTTEWTELVPQSPFYLFIPQDTSRLGEYEKGWTVREIFPVGSMGIKTNRDHLLVDFDEQVLISRVAELADSKLSDGEAQDRFHLEDGPYWNTKREREKIRSTTWRSNITKVLYRPFDIRSIFYQQNLIEIGRGGASTTVMQHMLLGGNVSLLATRQTKDQWDVSVTDKICGHKSCSGYDITSLFPLYLYPTSPKGGLFDTESPSSPGGRRSNLAPEFISDFAARLTLGFVHDGKGDLVRNFGPEDVFDYMYAVFHTPTYRSRYAEFLKMDFPRLPLTSNPELFRKLCALGSELIGLHLMEKHAPAITTYPITGANEVDKVRYTAPGEAGSEQGRVWINREQYFEGVPPEVWNFHVGGYQVCQKWLKDRKGRKLTYDDLTHYQRIVSALNETIRLMSEIDVAIDGHGAWPIQ